MTLSITTLCQYAECRVLSSVMFNVIMLSVVMLCVVMLSVVAPLNLPTKNRRGWKWLSVAKALPYNTAIIVK